MFHFSLKNNHHNMKKWKLGKLLEWFYFSYTHSLERVTSEMYNQFWNYFSTKIFIKISNFYCYSLTKTYLSKIWHLLRYCQIVTIWNLHIYHSYLSLIIWLQELRLEALVVMDSEINLEEMKSNKWFYSSFLHQSENIFPQNISKKTLPTIKIWWITD
jgi:hypothetical protein